MYALQRYQRLRLTRKTLLSALSLLASHLPSPLKMKKHRRHRPRRGLRYLTRRLNLH